MAVFRPTRPLFTANVNFLTEEQVRKDKQENTLRAFQIKQAHKQQQYQQEVSDIIDDKSLTRGEKGLKIASLRESMFPEEAMQETERRIGSMNELVTRTDVTTPEMKKVLETDYSRAIKGDVDAMASIAKAVKKQDIRGLGGIRATGADRQQQLWDNLDLMYNTLSANVNKLTPSEQQLLQISDVSDPAIQGLMFKYRNANWAKGRFDKVASTVSYLRGTTERSYGFPEQVRTEATLVNTGIDIARYNEMPPQLKSDYVQAVESNREGMADQTKAVIDNYPKETFGNWDWLWNSEADIIAIAENPDYMSKLRASDPDLAELVQ